MNEVFGIIATVLAVAGVFLNNRLNIVCFYLWLASNAICVGLWSLFARDIIFLVMAIEGLMLWRKKRRANSGVFDINGKKDVRRKSFLRI